MLADAANEGTTIIIRVTRRLLVPFARTHSYSDIPRGLRSFTKIS